MDALQLAHQQAEDAGLWFNAKTAAEAYLQAALRKLHAAVEAAPVALQGPPDEKNSAGQPLVGLSDERINALADQYGILSIKSAGGELNAFARAIESALRAEPRGEQVVPADGADKNVFAEEVWSRMRSNVMASDLIKAMNIHTIRTLINVWWDCRHLIAPPALQEGWQAVPVEPTEAMCDAAAKHLMSSHGGMSRAGHQGPYGVYRVMLSAAPKQGDQ